MRLSVSAILLLVFSCVVAPAQTASFAGDPLAAAAKLVDTNHYKRARTLVEARLKVDPNDAQALFLSSKIQEALGNLHGAMLLAEKSVAADPRNASYHAQLAECYAYTADR